MWLYLYIVILSCSQQAQLIQKSSFCLFTTTLTFANIEYSIIIISSMRLRLRSDYTNQQRNKTKLIHSQNNQFIIVSQLNPLKSNTSKENKKEEITSRKQPKIKMTSIQLFLANRTNGDPLLSSFDLIKPLKRIESRLVTLSLLQSPHFHTLSYDIRELMVFSKRILGTSGFALKLPGEMVEKLIGQISQAYNPLSYHNFSHGFSLMLLNHQCLTKAVTLKNALSEEEYFCILIAGLAHDIGHNGTNNQFQIKTNSEIAKLANNHSVLENMHIRNLWSLLEQNTQCNFIKFTNNSQKAKQIITRLILNTDMTLHLNNLSALKDMKGKLQLSNQEDKWFILQQMFHACDIGNSTQEFDDYMDWTALLSHEFHQQTKLQHQLNIEITKPFIYTGLQALYNDQIWFLGTIVQPLWKQMRDLFPCLEVYYTKVENNLRAVKLKVKEGC